MRVLLPLLLSALLGACASQETQSPAKTMDAPKAEAPKAAEAKKAPQCWSGDDARFFELNQKTKVSGIEVVCTATADGKHAVWLNANQK